LELAQHGGEQLVRILLWVGADEMAELHPKRRVVAHHREEAPEPCAASAACAGLIRRGDSQRSTEPSRSGESVAPAFSAAAKSSAVAARCISIEPRSCTA